MSTDRQRPSLNRKLISQEHPLIGRFYDVFGSFRETNRLQINVSEATTLLRHNKSGEETKEDFEKNFDFATDDFFDALVWKNLLQLYIFKNNHDLGKAVHIIKYGNGTFGVMVSSLDALNEILMKDALTQICYNYIQLMSQDALLDDNEIDALEKILLDLETDSKFFPEKKSSALQQQLLVRLRSSLDAKTKELQQMRQEIQSIQEQLAKKEGQLAKLQKDIKKMSAEIDAKKQQLQQRESIKESILKLQLELQLELQLARVAAATPALQGDHTTKLSVADCEKKLAEQEQKLKKLPTSAEIKQWIEIAEALVAPRQKEAADLAAKILTERAEAGNHIVRLESRIKERQTKLALQEKWFNIVKTKPHPSADQKEKERKREAKHSRKNASTFFAPAADKEKKQAKHSRKNASIFYAPTPEDEDETNPDITTESASSSRAEVTSSASSTASSAPKTEAPLEVAMAKLSIVEAASSSMAEATSSASSTASSAPKTEATVEASSASVQSRGYRS